MPAPVVEDSNVMRRLNRGASRQAGIEIADEAVEAARSTHYDPILKDPARSSRGAMHIDFPRQELKQFGLQRGHT